MRYNSVNVQLRVIVWCVVKLKGGRKLFVSVFVYDSADV